MTESFVQFVLLASSNVQYLPSLPQPLTWVPAPCPAPSWGCSLLRESSRPDSPHCSLQTSRHRETATLLHLSPTHLPSLETLLHFLTTHFHSPATLLHLPATLFLASSAGSHLPGDPHVGHHLWGLKCTRRLAPGAEGGRQRASLSHLL